MAIRLILLDIDGTLTNSKKVITPETKAALLRVQQAGVKLALSSGRPQQGLVKLARELQMPEFGGYFVCYNGSRVVDCKTGEFLFNQPMTAQEAKAVLNHMKNFSVMPMIDRGEYMYVTDVFNHTIHPELEKYPADFNVMQYESRANGFLLCEKHDLEEFVDFPLNKILTYADPAYLNAHWQEMAAPFEESLSCMFTAPFYYEFTAKGVDKAKAIREGLLPLGFSREEMMAFGDAQNDASMLELAGIGVAMGNAVPQVKALADEVTDSNDEDGIAHSLYKHFPELF